MRNILAHVTHKDKQAFAGKLKQIWLAPDETTARNRANALAEEYEKRFPKAIATLEDGLDDSLAFYSFPKLDSRKISSTNMLERLNREIRRRTRVIASSRTPIPTCGWSQPF
jgi:transposase-like protein